MWVLVIRLVCGRWSPFLLIDARITHKHAHTQAVTARPSLSGLHRDADAWEEDTLPAQAGGNGGEEGEDGKPRLSLVVIGHVDAGKSTLMGQVGGWVYGFGVLVMFVVSITI